MVMQACAPLLVTLILLVSTGFVPVHGTGDGQSEIPEWVRGIAGLWADGLIDDAAFIQAISFLIEHGIIVVGDVEPPPEKQAIAPELRHFDKATAVTDGTSFKKGDIITVNGRVSSVDPLPMSRTSFDTNEVELQTSRLDIMTMTESASGLGYYFVTSHSCIINNETYQVSDGPNGCDHIMNLKINRDTAFTFDVVVDTDTFEDYGPHKIRVSLTSEANDGERVYYHWVTTSEFSITP